MKVLLINGSPHSNGCTRAALDEIACQLAHEGVATELIHIGTEAIRGCTACGGCDRANADGCIFTGDRVNEAIHAMQECL